MLHLIVYRVVHVYLDSIIFGNVLVLYTILYHNGHAMRVHGNIVVSNVHNYITIYRNVLDFLYI